LHSALASIGLRSTSLTASIGEHFRRPSQRLEITGGFLNFQNEVRPRRGSKMEEKRAGLRCNFSVVGGLL
jgi:hypothetical protein